MFLDHLKLLACPACHEPLSCTQADAGSAPGVITEGRLSCGSCKQEYPVVAGVPRFVPRENYASGFGLEWTKHARTQYDSYSGIPASEERFFGQTGWPKNLAGEMILEVGSGSGRFTEQAARTGATVVSLDYSYAVDANYASNGARKNVLILQADVFAMPFRPKSFDRVFCFGMLQHTPSPSRAFAALTRFEGRWGFVRGYLQGFVLAHCGPDQVLGAALHSSHEPRSSLCAGSALGGFHVAAGGHHPAPAERICHQLAAAGRRLQLFGAARQHAEGMGVPRYLRHVGPRYDRPATRETFREWAVEAKLTDIEAFYSPHGVVLRARAAAGLDVRRIC